MEKHQQRTSVRYNGCLASSQQEQFATRAWTQDALEIGRFESPSLGEGFQEQTPSVLGARCFGNKFVQWDQMMNPDVSLLECASTPNLPFDTSNAPLDAFDPHTYANRSPSTANPVAKIVSTHPCSNFISTPNFKSPEFPAFMKSTGCCPIQSTNSSLPLPVSKVNILTELYALQQRCSTLEFALSLSVLTSPEHQDGYSFASKMLADKGLAMSLTLDHVNLSSSTSTTQPGGCEESFLGDMHLDPMYQSLQSPLNPATPTLDTLGPKAFMLPQDILPKDHCQHDAPVMDNFEWGLHGVDIFGFNPASLERLQQEFDVLGEETMSTADTPAGNMSNIGPILPTISRARSRRAVGSSASNRLDRRHHCPSCMQTFHRRSDRDRHALVHNPAAPRFDCSFPGCDRVGRNGFLRRDKLTQHQAYKGH